MKKLFPMTADVWASLRSAADCDDNEGVAFGTFLLVCAPFVDVIVGWVLMPPVRLVGWVLRGIFRHRYQPKSAS